MYRDRVASISPTASRKNTGKAVELANSFPIILARQGLSPVPGSTTLGLSLIWLGTLPGVMANPHIKHETHRQASPLMDPLQPHCSSITCARGATTKVPTPAALCQ